MEHFNFQKLLFRSAVCVMACDGEIHEDEKKEIEKIVNTTHYFKGMDCSSELQHIIAEIGEQGRTVIRSYFDQIRESDFTPVQELLLLEILMRIINADGKLDPNEIKFLHIVKSKLKVHEEIIIERFGQVDLLFNRHYKNVDKSFKDEFIGKFPLPKLKNLKGTDIEVIMEKEES